MKWSLLELNKYHETPLTFSETLDLKKELMKRDNQILDITPIEVSGLVTVSKSDYLIHYTLKATLTLPSSRSLDPVGLPLDLVVDEVFMTPEQLQMRTELISEEEVLLIEGQTIDLDESVADNILLAIPLQVLTKEEELSNQMPAGKDWEVISEEDYLQQKETAAPKIDPRLAKLSELFNTTEDDDK